MRVDFSVDTRELNKLAQTVAALKGNLPRQLARSMTYAARDAQQELRQQTPRFVDRPTPGTLRATFVEGATADNLTVRVGFRDQAAKGTAPAEYLQPMVGGGPRPLKRSERQLQGRGLLRAGEFITPADVHPLRLNRYGNIPGPRMVQVLSQLRGFGEQGYNANRRAGTPGGYFIGQPGGLPRGIYARVGRNKRGFHTVFHITRQPKYQPTFPVREILQRKFSQRFPSIFERLVFQAR
jgi:hypothetical protein